MLIHNVGAFRILVRLQRAEPDGGHVIEENLVEELGLSPSRVSSIPTLPQRYLANTTKA
jgi:hypothetical protein